jgi:hypothetical protein
LIYLAIVQANYPTRYAEHAAESIVFLLIIEF